MGRIMLLDNLLVNVLIVDSDGIEKRKLRAFSHLTANPDDVQHWIPLELEGLGDPIVFDRRTCETMQGQDLDFYIAKGPVPFVRAVRIQPKIVKKKKTKLDPHKNPKKARKDANRRAKKQAKQHAREAKQRAREAKRHADAAIIIQRRWRRQYAFQCVHDAFHRWRKHVSSEP